VDDFADALFRFVTKNLRDRERAKDIVQDTFAKLWEKVDTVTFEKAKSYLFTSSYHTMIDVIRKEKRTELVEEWNGNEGIQNPGKTGLKEILDKALHRLPEIQRTVVLLRDYEGYSYDEIGGITGLSEAQVKVYIYRARTAMKNFLGKLDLVV
jgi:RNA polymerase sigma-70 factor (ECF subfamily)